MRLKSRSLCTMLVVMCGWSVSGAVSASIAPVSSSPAAIESAAITESAATTSSVQSTTVQPSKDLEASMKAMAFHLKKGVQATDIATVEAEVLQLQNLVSSVQLYQFSADKQEIFQQGLAKVQQQLLLVQHSLSQQDLAKAQQQLKHVDEIRKEYHRHRSPSVWRLFFGG